MRKKNKIKAPYKSKYEELQAARLEDNNINFEYEPIQLDWVEIVNHAYCGECYSEDVKKNRKYTPDFWFPKSKIFVETKGKFTPEARTKMYQICYQSEYEVRMVFMRDNYLTRKHGMKYSRWCEIHDIKYAIGDIPIEWVEDDKNER